MPRATTYTDGSPVKFRHFLTGKDDATIFNVSFLSRPAEWHALGAGAAAGATGQKEVIGAFLLYLLGRQTGKFNAGIPHIKDAAREPVYAAIGVLIGMLLYTFAFRVPPDFAGWL